MRRIVALAAVALVVGACTSGTTGSPSIGPTPSPAGSIAGSPSPVPTPTPGSTPAPTAAPTPAPTPIAIEDLAWERVTTLSGVSLGGDMVGFAGGYVVQGEDGVFWSADGAAWTAVAIPTRVSSVATDGRGVLLVGSEERDCGVDTCPPETTGCGGPVCKATPIAWRSTDGLTWERSKPWPTAAVDSNAYLALDAAAWAVPTGGWDAALSYLTGDSSHLIDVFHSDDGLSWVVVPSDLPVSIEGAAEEPFWGPGTADHEGRRLLAGWSAGEPAVTGLFTSADGRSWLRLDGFPGADASVGDVIAPMVGGTPLWLVAGTGAIDPEDGQGRPTVWASPDLVEWSGQSLPTGGAAGGAVGAVSAASFGYVAVGRLAGADDTSVDTSWLGADGVEWIPLAIPIEPGTSGPSLVADGPAGVIGISFPPDESDLPLPSIVWALR
ncbi:MAG: hypothetical protein MUC54_09005 [Chloroflexi bacterium]|jgi:hypothetical protein|nr:hypothetical protein [Chloroflexota bacterium]